MPWLLFLLAAGALAMAFMAASVAVVVVGLIAALGLTLAGIMSLLSRRVGNQSRQEAMMIDPQELQRLREQAEARRQATQTSGNDPAGI